MSLRILITGAGSGVGHAIAKALHLSGLEPTLIFADIDPFNPGFFRSDEAVLIPRVEDEGSLEKMIGILRDGRVDVVMVGSVFDLTFFAENRAVLERETGALVVASPPSVMEMASDKWLTAKFLEDAGLPHAPALLAEDVDEAVAFAESLGFPVILKPRRGRGSHGVHVVRDADALRGLIPVVDEPMVQRMIAEPKSALSAEFTCGLLKTADGVVHGPLTARRSLRTGHSWVVEVGIFEQLHPLLQRIGKALDFYGPLNVQLMVGPDGPVPFEFNPRFSGTTAMRAHFGFNEPERIVRRDRLGETLTEPEIRAGMAFRYLEEVFVDGLSAETLDQPPYPQGEIHRWF